MRAKQFIPEAAIGTNPKRPARAGSRPDRGHNPESRYKELDDKFNTPEQLKKDADYREYRKGVKQPRKEQPAPFITKDVAEASYIDGKKEDPKSLRWKQTSLSRAAAVAKFGPKNVRSGGKSRSGEDTIEVLVPLGGADVSESADDSELANADYGRKILSGLEKLCHAIKARRPEVFHQLDDVYQSGGVGEWIVEALHLNMDEFLEFSDKFEEAGGDPIIDFFYAYQEGRWNEFIAPWQAYTAKVLRSRGSAPAVQEGYQDFNKVEPYYVCLAGKPVKKFDYYEDARRFHDNWKKKLYREGDKEKADKITLMPIMDEQTVAEDAREFKGPHGTLDIDQKPGRTIVKRRDYTDLDIDNSHDDTFSNMKLRGKGQGSGGSTGTSSLHAIPKNHHHTRPDFGYDINDVTTYDTDYEPGDELDSKFNSPEELQKDKEYRDYRKGIKRSPKAIAEEIASMEAELAEHGKASRELCKSSKPDADLGASMLSSCKSQGLRARDGDKSHKLGKTAKSRVKVGGHRIKGRKYGGPLPDWS